MTGLMWTAVVAVAVLLIAIALRAAGARQWAASIVAQTRHLEEARVDGRRGDASAATVPARFDARELQGLPAPVQRYFHAVLKDGQPLVDAATLEMAGTINLSAAGEQWKAFTSSQRVATQRPGFLWNARVQMVPGVPMHVEDSYIAGQGRLSARLLGLFTVASAQGGGELARGEFMRWFAEAPWYPTALLPSQGVRWDAVDATSALATLSDGELTLRLLFRFDAAGLIGSMRAESRAAGVGRDLLMLPWECTFSDYQWQHGLRIPMAGEAAWMRPQGRRRYFMGRVTGVAYEFLR